MLIEDDHSKWKETISEVVEDMTELQHAKLLINKFNNSLKLGELPRRLKLLRVHKEVGKFRHDWIKKSLVTEKGGYDIYICSNCKATGKRHGLSSTIVPDMEYEQFCKTKL
jgi:hypothetical protein